MTFIDAWNWLYDHPINRNPQFKTPHEPDGIASGLYGLVIDVGSSFELSVIVRLEIGPFVNTTAEYDDFPDNWERSHDIRLDVWAPSFEEAVIKLAERVKEYYGDYESQE